MRADCARVLVLVDKLADGETAAREKKAAEDHLAHCVDCNAHLQLLNAMARQARASLPPEPPPEYFDQLPRRVLDRLERPDRGGSRVREAGFWSRLFAPARLRWHAVGATLLVLIAAGAAVLRMNPMDPGRQAEPPSPAAEPPLIGSIRPPVEAEAGPTEPARDAPDSPEMARDEARPPGAGRRRMEAPLSAEAPEAVPSQAARLGRAPAPESESLPAPAAPLENAVDPCEELRQRSFLRESTGLASADARYELAACSLARYESDPREDLRRIALEDGEAFLELEREGQRAEEIGRALHAIRGR